MNKQELVNAVAEKTELTKKDSAKVVEAVVSTITETLAKGETLSVPKFGKFEVRTRAARDGVNPATQEKIRIKETKVPAFKASQNLKDVIKQG